MRSTSVLSAILVMSCLSLSLSALPARAEDLPRFDIPAQPLVDSLRAVASQTNMNVFFEPKLIAGRQAPAISKTDGVEAALRKLLVGSGLTFRFIDERTVTVISEDKNGAEKITESRTDVAEPSSLRLAQAEGTTDGSAPNGEQQSPPKEEGEREEGVQLEEIVVTGTHIRGRDPVGSQLVVIDRKAIEAAGYTSTEQLVDRIPQNFGGGARPEATSVFVSAGDDTDSNLSGASTVNLRGLGSAATLVLVNGHRLPGSGAGQFSDISIIPLSAIERVEILLDGASAIYGSDAVAGVVNIILRKNFDGAETALQYGAVTDGGHSQLSASQSIGHSWGTGSGLLSAEYFDQRGLLAQDRSIVINSPIGGLLRGRYLIPESERVSLFGSASQAVTSSVQLNLDALYSEREDRTDFGFDLGADQFGKEDVLSIGSNLAMSLQNDWSLTFSGSYSEGKGHIIITQDIQDQIFRHHTWTAESILQGQVLNLPAGPLQIATGVGYRDQGYELVNVPTDSRQPADRSAKSIFGEVRIPIVDTVNAKRIIRRLEFSIAGRADDYSDFGSSVDPKFGLLYSPIDHFNIRATFGTSFKAPDLSQVASVDTAFVVLSRESDPLAPSGESIVGAIGGVVPGLGPENGRTTTFGIEYSPSDALDLSLTYFSINYDDKVARPATAPSIIVTDPTRYGVFLTRDPTPAQLGDVQDLVGDRIIDNAGADLSEVQVIVDSRFRNLSAQSLDGIDFHLNGSQALPKGSLSFELFAQYIFDFTQQLLPGDAEIEILNQPARPVDLNGRLTVGWSHAGLSINTTLNHVDNYVDIGVIPNAEIRSFDTIDASLGYMFSRDSGLLPGVSLSLHAFNLFDEAPPAVASTFAGYDAANASVRGRFLSLQVRKSW